MRIAPSRISRRVRRQFRPGLIGPAPDIVLERRAMAASFYTLPSNPITSVASGFVSSDAVSQAGVNDTTGVTYWDDDPKVAPTPGDGSVLSKSKTGRFTYYSFPTFDENYNTSYVPEVDVWEWAKAESSLTASGQASLELDAKLHTCDAFAYYANTGNYYSMNKGTFGVPWDGPTAAAYARSTAPIYYGATGLGPTVTVSFQASLSAVEPGFSHIVSLNVSSPYIDVFVDSYMSTGLVITNHATGDVLYTRADFGDPNVASVVDVSFTFDTEDHPVAPEDSFLMYGSSLMTGPTATVGPGLGISSASQSSDFNWHFKMTS